MIEIKKTEIKPLKKNKSRWDLFALGFQNSQGLQAKKSNYQDEKQRQWIDLLADYHKELQDLKQEHAGESQNLMENPKPFNVKEQNKEIWESWSMVAPYDEWLVFWAKNLGGRWSMETKAWTLEGPKQALDKAWTLFENVQLNLENASKNHNEVWEKERKKDYFFEKQNMKLALEEKNGMLGYWVSFPYDQSHVDEIRSLRVAQWNRDEKKWFIPLDKSFKIKDWIVKKEKEEHEFQTKKEHWKSGEWKWYEDQEKKVSCWSWENEEMKLESMDDLSFIFSHNEKDMEHEITIKNFRLALCPLWILHFNRLSQIEIKRKGYSGIQRALWDSSMKNKNEITVKVSWEHQEELKQWHQSVMDDLKKGVAAQLSIKENEIKDDFFEWNLNWKEEGVGAQGTSWPSWTEKMPIYGWVLEKMPDEKKAKVILFSAETMLNILKENEIWFHSVWRDQKKTLQEWDAWVECLEIKKCMYASESNNDILQCEINSPSKKIKRL